MTGPGATDAGRPGSARLVGTLGAAGGVAGLFIILAWVWASPRIEAHRALVLREAIQEVLGDPARTRPLYVTEAGLQAEVPAGADSVRAERVFVGYDAGGRRVGFAITGAEPGFQDVIALIFGYDAATGRLLGMKVLESKETPGLGDKIEKDDRFVRAFEGTATPLVGVKPGAGKGTPGEVDVITGATISSRTVIAIINHRLERLRPLLEAWTESAP